MADEEEKSGSEVWKIVGAIVALFIVVLIAAMLTKGKVINEYAGMAFFIFTFLIVFMWLFFSFIIKMRKVDPGDKAQSGIDYYMRKINDILVTRPEGEPMRWEGGKYSRYFMKTIFDLNRQPHKYVGVVGFLKDSDKRVVLIYDIDDNDIVRFVGDPAPMLMNDPFYEFRPFDSAARGLAPPPMDYYGRRGPVNINVRPTDRNRDEAGDDLSELDKLRK